jgi:hypothetical protein
MNMTSTLIVAGAIVVLVIVCVALIASRSTQRKPALKPLPQESHDRYVARWDATESRFVDSPEDAVREADALMLAILAEREHPLAEARLPANMRKARRLGSGQEGTGGTEGMRQAMLLYRSVIEEYAQPVDVHKPAPEGRREIA